MRRLLGEHGRVRVMGDMVEVFGEERRRTELAVLWYDGDREAWLPLALVEVAEDGESVMVPEWLAIERGLV